MPTALTKIVFSESMIEEVDKLNAIISVNESLLETEMLMEGGSLAKKDWQYKEYSGFAKMAGSDSEKAKYHQKAGMQASAAGHHDRAERHLNLAGAFARRNKIFKAANAAKSQHTAAGEAAKKAGDDKSADMHFTKAHNAHIALSKLQRGSSQKRISNRTMGQYKS